MTSTNTPGDTTVAYLVDEVMTTRALVVNREVSRSVVRSRELAGRLGSPGLAPLLAEVARRWPDITSEAERLRIAGHLARYIASDRLDGFAAARAGALAG